MKVRSLPSSRRPRRPRIRATTPSLHERFIHMHSVRLSRVGRFMPSVAVLLGSALFAGPASAAAPTGGPVLPAIGITYNTGEILYTDPPGNPTTATVTRGAAALTSGTF